MKNQIKTLIIISLLLVQACGKRGKESTKMVIADDIIAVKTEQIVQSDGIDGLEVSGLVSSLLEARLSFKTGGIIDKIYVKEGQTIQKGQLLATLNLTEIAAQVNQANESVEKAERDLKRITNLYRDSVSTFEQVQNLTTALNVAKQSQQIARYNLSYSKIYANATGVIIKKIMNEGEVAGPGNPILFMNATGANDWILKVGLTDQDWARIKIGDNAKVMLDAFPLQKIEGKISNLAQAADQNTGLYQAEIKLAPSVKKLATGLFGKANIMPSIKQTATSISINALIEGNGKNAFVYTVDENLIAHKVPILVENITNGRVFLSANIKDVTTIITDGSAYLVDGAKVKIVK